MCVQSMDMVAIILHLFSVVKMTFTMFLKRHKQICKDPLLTFRNLVQFPLYFPKNGGIVSIIPRIILLKVNILITIVKRATIEMVIIIQQEVKGEDVDVFLTMLPVFLIHSHTICSTSAYKFSSRCTSYSNKH
jgi:hypothetical protein